MSYITYSESPRDQTGNIITFTQFEECNLLSETRDDTEKSNKYDDNSTLPPLIIEEEMDEMSSGDGSDDEPMSTDMLEDIRDGSQYHPIIHMREARYNICDRIKRGQAEYKVALLSTRNMDKGLHKVVKAVFNEIFQALPIIGESRS